MSDVDTAFDAPWIEPVDGFGDVSFARADCDYWAWRAAKEKDRRKAADLAKLATLPNLMLDPLARLAHERRIDDQKVFLGEVIDDSRDTAEGLKQLLLDAIVRGGRSKEEAERIRKRIGTGRQMQLATIICSEPRPTIEQYREAVRKACLERGMHPDAVARLTDVDLIRLAAEVSPPRKEDAPAAGGQAGADPLDDAGSSPTDMPM